MGHCQHELYCPGAVQENHQPTYHQKLPPGLLLLQELREDVLDELFSSGMKIATLAIESGSEYTQAKIIKKRCNLDRARRLVKYIRDKGHYVRCYFILELANECQIS